MTVGETSGVTIEEAQKYAGEDRNELNMVFQFEHVEARDQTMVNGLPRNTISRNLKRL